MRALSKQEQSDKDFAMCAIMGTVCGLFLFGAWLASLITT